MKKPLEGLLMVSDMDGTLLDDDKKISQENLKAIRWFMEQGGTFSIASGRSASSVWHYLDEIGLTAPIICCNGGGIYDYASQKFLWNAPVDAQVSADIIEDVHRLFPHVGVEVYTCQKIYIPYENWYTQHHMEIEHLEFAKDYDLQDTPWLKAIFMESPEKVALVEQFLEEQGYAKKNPNIRFVYSEPCYYEMMAKDCTKGHALTALGQMLHIPKENIIAVGDNYNDEEMIRLAGCSFSMGNGVPLIQEIAQHVVADNNHSGVAEAIYRIPEIYGRA